MDRIAGLQIIFDVLNDEINQITVCVDEYRYEQISLRGKTN